MADGKAPADAPGFKSNGGRDPGPNGKSLIKVQPPRREDLQPAYAQTLQGDVDDAAAHGWYGAMSESMPWHSGMIEG